MPLVWPDFQPASDNINVTRLLAPFTKPGLPRDSLELLLVAVAFLLYFVVRANVIDRPDLAIANATHIVDAEKTLGVYWERSLQQSILDERLIVRFFNFAYFWLDFPLIAALGLLLYFRRRSHYTFTRDAILFSGGLALISYALFPVAPPRLLPNAGILDTLQALDNLSYQAQSTQFFVNPYAAMPSLHVGWAVLIAIGMYRAFPRNRLVMLFAAVHPITQWSSTVFTGNHYILDGVGGLVVAALGLALATFMQRRGYAYLREKLGIEHEPVTSRPAQKRSAP
jgi:membrane-associated phospholipid phosphatase